MKNWILSHKILSIVLACAIGVGAICAVVLPIALRHKHEFSAEWSYDDTEHFHKCLDENCKTVSDKAAHVFDKEVVADKYIVAKATYTEAAKYYKSCLCGAKGTEIFNSGSSLSAKDNVINLKEGVTLGKTYDGEAYTLTAEEITRNGEGAITFMYKLKDSEAEYTETAPKKAGEYTVKVTVAATPEWKETAKTFDFEIKKKPLTEERVTQEYDGRSFIIGEPKGKVGSDDVQIEVMMSGKDVGATKESVALSGDDADNYSITLNDVTASISKKDITKYIPNNYSYFYNASTSLFLYNGSTGSFGTVNGDAVIIRIIFESKDVGTTKITGVSITGVASGNYVIDHTKLSGKISAVPLDLKGIHFKIFKFGEDNYYSVPLKLTQANVDNSFNNDDITIKMVKYNGTHAIGDTWTLTNADKDCFEITGADRNNYSIVRFTAEEDFACTATLAVDESMPELTDAVNNKELNVGTYWYKKELGAGYKTLEYAQNKMKITVYKPDGNEVKVIDNEMLVPDETTIYLYIEVKEDAFRGPRVTKSTTHAELTIGTTYDLPKAPNTHNKGKKHFLKVNLPQNGYYQITKLKFYISDNINFYDEQGKKNHPA